jgi:hypothetical protein
MDTKKNDKTKDQKSGSVTKKTEENKKTGSDNKSGNKGGSRSDSNK